MQKITPFLWFDDNAEEAMHYYVSVFERSRVLGVQRAGDRVLGVSFELDGVEFKGLNGGPAHAVFTESVSFYVDCETQAEIDRLWDRLTADGGSPVMCGWLKDRFGLFWQIVPRRLGEILSGEDRAGARRAFEAMMGMVKLDLAALEAAYAG